MQTIELLQEIREILKRKAIWLIVPAILFAAILGYRAHSEPTMHISMSKIFPLAAEGSALKGLGLAFGFGGGGGTEYYNVTELVNSRNVSRKVVQYSAQNKKYKSLIEWILEDFKKRSEGKVSISKNNEENIHAAAQVLISSTKVAVEKSGFTSIKVSTCDPELSLRLNQCILTGLSDFYINTKTEKARSDLEKIANLRDSLKKELSAIELSLLNFDDRNKYLVSEKAKLPYVQLLTLKEEVAEYYRIATESLQNAKFMLLNQSPIFQVLDYPTKPVTTVPPKWKKSVVIGFIVGLVLGTIFVLRKIIGRLILAEMNKKTN
jgi:capsule polysaccharide export protein KpsE/RkpR